MRAAGALFNMPPKINCHSREGGNPDTAALAAPLSAAVDGFCQRKKDWIPAFAGMTWLFLGIAEKIGKGRAKNPP